MLGSAGPAEKQTPGSGRDRNKVLEGTRWKVRDQEPASPLLDSACTYLGKCTHTRMRTRVYTPHTSHTKMEKKKEN